MHTRPDRLPERRCRTLQAAPEARMKQHDTYNSAVTLDDFGDQRRAHLTDSIGAVFDESDEVVLTESPSGAAELRVPDTIPAVDKPDVRETIETHLEAPLDTYETVVLNKRVSWPDPRYEICVDFE